MHHPGAAQFRPNISESVFLPTMGSEEFVANDEWRDGDDSPFPLTEVDRWVLSQTDDEFQLHSWDELKQIIGERQVSHKAFFVSGLYICQPYLSTR